MNFYREWRRLFIEIDDSKGGFCIAIGLQPPPPDEYAADDVPHPFAGPDALAGNVTTPAGAQSGEVTGDPPRHERGEVIDVTKGPYVPNPPSNWDPS